MGNDFEKFVSVGIVAHPLSIIEDDNKEKDILNIIKLIASDIFFSNIEIPEIKDREIKKRIKKIIEISKIRPIFTSAYTIFEEDLDLNSFDMGKLERSIKRIKEQIDLAYFFKSEMFTITSGLDVFDKREEAKKILIDSLKDICMYSQEQSIGKNKPIPIVLETFDREITHKLLIGPTDEAIEIIKEVSKDYNNIGLMLDLAHLHLMEDNIDDSVSVSSKYLRHIHIGNCVLKNRKDPRYGDTHPYFGYPMGEIDTKIASAFLKSLNNNRYFNLRYNPKLESLPTINIEIIRRQAEDISILISNLKRFFIDVWNKTFNN